MNAIGLRGILLIIAVICFVLAAIDLKVSIDLVALGLAFFAGAFLVGEGGGWGRRT